VQTGLQALRKVPSLKEGGRVLVIGASGGCGLAGVQLARAKVGPSGKVIGVCSAASAPLVQSLGVTDALLDYTNPASFLEGLKAWAPFDIVYDTVSSWEATDTLGGGTPYAQAVTPYLASGVGAKVVAINGSTRQWVGALLGWSGSSTYELFMQEPSQGDLMATVDLVEKGLLKPIIDSQHPFTGAGCEAAYARLKSRRAKGKVVVDVVTAAAQ
jgi:NADPH:quinone reductase-like Zn-dependent oxidoreductase